MLHPPPLVGRHLLLLLICSASGSVLGGPILPVGVHIAPYQGNIGMSLLVRHTLVIVDQHAMVLVRRYGPSSGSVQ
jgi:hypothetical protein